jgi:hypothetical protein
MTDDQRKAHIQALLEERATYDRSGKQERVEQVDEQLRAFAHDAAPPHRRGERRPKNTAETR